MAYTCTLTEADKIFEQYLHTASFNNVVIEEAFDAVDPVQRWRLHCKKCGATLTYTDVSAAQMAREYSFTSILDDKVAKFCKAHTHQVKHETAKMYDLNEAYEKFNKLPAKKPLPIKMVKLVPAPIVPAVPELPAPLPMKRLGRKI
jgi:hypothetical protein